MRNNKLFGTTKWVFMATFQLLQSNAPNAKAQGQVEVAFLPDGDGERLVLKTISSAGTEISVLMSWCSGTVRPLAGLYTKHFERNAKLSKVLNPL